MSIKISSEGVDSPIPDQIEIDEKEGYLETAIKSHHTTSQPLQFLRCFFRDRFYLPLNQPVQEPFFIDSGRYAEQFVAMLKGENPHLDPTFPLLPQIIELFDIRDIPVEVRIGNETVVFQTRVIESKREIEGKNLRLILITFYDHQVKTEDSLSPWNPMLTDELTGGILDVLKAYKQKTHIDSMMYFSLGNLTCDGFKHISPENSDLIPNTLILNRGLTSIQKVSQQLYPFPVSSLLYNAVYYLGLDANPERELTHFFQRMQSHGTPLDRRKIVVIEARNDRYFSGEGKLDDNFCPTLSKTGVSVSHGTFFMPMLAEPAHHAHRLDLILNNNESGTETTDFLPIPTNRSLAEGIATNIFRETTQDNTHTCMIVGGNKDKLDSVTYLQAVPLIAGYLEGLKT